VRLEFRLTCNLNSNLYTSVFSFPTLIHKSNSLSTMVDVKRKDMDRFSGEEWFNDVCVEFGLSYVVSLFAVFHAQYSQYVTEPF
jgi:hypothetical protein